MFSSITECLKTELGTRQCENVKLAMPSSRLFVTITINNSNVNSYIIILMYVNSYEHITTLSNN